MMGKIKMRKEWKIESGVVVKGEQEEEKDLKGEK